MSLRASVPEFGVFRELLADVIDDTGLRMLMGEWLAERGSPKALGYIWMGQRHRFPYYLPASRKWSWTTLRHADPDHNHLPRELYDALAQAVDTDWKKYVAIHQAEEDLAQTLAGHPDMAGLSTAKPRR